MLNKLGEYGAVRVVMTNETLKIEIKSDKSELNCSDILGIISSIETDKTSVKRLEASKQYFLIELNKSRTWKQK